jgi:hypothetical protein
VPFTSDLIRHRGAGCTVDIRDHDAGALAREAHRRCAANARAATGDDGYLALEKRP